MGASAAGPPRLPLQVVAGKSGGINPGFVARDAEGRHFVVKFDTKDNPEMQTSINTIVNRIFWTLGYNVANDTVFTFQPEDLGIAQGAAIKDEVGNKRPITQRDLDRVLRLAPRWPRGHYRATASEFVNGTPKGGFAAEGVRKDDANDRIPHEHRREIRGLRVIAAWLNHTDVKEDNTLDAYVEQNGRKFLKHFFIDFGESMAGHSAEKGRYEDGYENWMDWGIQTRATLSLGLWVRPWEALEQTRWPSVGAFSADHFDPVQWREAYPYWPFAEADAADSYWAAKLVMKFDRPLLTRLVQEGQLSHPEAAAYLVDTLLARRDKVGQAYMQTLTALDQFQIDSQQLCMSDLSVAHGLVTASMVELLNERNEVVWDRLVNNNGRLCVPIRSGDDYTIYRLRSRRRLERLPIMQIHFKGGANARILGVVRVEP